jgi:hypothetical protein
MKIQPEMKKHEIVRIERRTERHAEDSQLIRLKTRLQHKLTVQQPTLFAMHTDGRVNVA